MESLAPERQEMVHTLMAVAGIEDVDFAREFLQDNGWQLEPSVNAYMMMIGEDAGDGGGTGGMGGIGSMGGNMSSSFPSAAPSSAAPDPPVAPPMVQRLVDDIPGAGGPVYEAYRNFAAEGMQVLFVACKFIGACVAAARKHLLFVFCPRVWQHVCY